MGSFNSTCAVSGMPLQAGDKVRILLLTQNPYSETHRAHSMHGWWVPRTFPIRGEYNDYGTVENVEEGLVQDLWLQTLKLDLIPQGTGENEVHDVPTFFDMPFEDFLKALWEGRVTVSRRLRKPEASLIDQPPFDVGKPDWLPTLTRVRDALSDLAASTDYGREGWLVDEPSYGMVRVRWVPKEFGANTEGKLAEIATLLPKFATVITAGYGSSRAPELLVLPKPGPDHYRYDAAPEKPLAVSYAMIREDVWQALVAMPCKIDWSDAALPSVEVYREHLLMAYQAESDREKHRKGLFDRLKAIKDSPKKDEAEEEAAHVELHTLILDDLEERLADTAWAVDRHTWAGLPLGLNQQWRYLIERQTPLDQVRGFIDSVAEVSRVALILGNVRFMWRPSTTGGPQVGEFKAHAQFFEEMLKIAQANAAEQTSDE